MSGSKVGWTTPFDDYVFTHKDDAIIHVIRKLTGKPYDEVKALLAQVTMKVK